VYLLAKNKVAGEWLSVHFTDLREKFKKLHKAETEELERHHPHELYLEERLIESRVPFTADPPQVGRYAWAGGHWSKSHAERTIKDLKSILLALGAKLEDFDVHDSENDEQETPHQHA